MLVRLHILSEFLDEDCPVQVFCSSRDFVERTILLRGKIRGSIRYRSCMGRREGYWVLMYQR